MQNNREPNPHTEQCIIKEPEPHPPRLLTRLEVASMLNVSASLVSKLLSDGKLPGIRVGRCRRWALADVKAFIEASRQTGGANE